ncbi:amino acid ABC transporter permease [Paenibacillus polymyxa]|uniref:amino acid ABC transporter permease n=1 Tax=Paenibacillus polymyxa TaxID=1406 RepID=UPI002AB35AFF|nr:amino acid ABC transporter permease [Paenibacillus polymyxa]MDY8048728.1 amino acid ABC transporter permease [Paenibacillus polymyxa]
MSMEYILRIMKPMLEGAQMTVILFFFTLILSIPLGFIVTLLAKSRIKPIAWLMHTYIYVIRGTPLLLQLLFFCFGLPMLPVIGEYLVLDRTTAAVLAFVLNYAAYFAEIFRGGMLSIDKGQYEASQVLGLSKSQTLIRVIVPQMVRIALPAVTNEATTLVKDTALLYAVAVPELLHFANTAVNRDFSIVPYVVAAVIYLLLALVLTLFFRALEKRFKFE